MELVFAWAMAGAASAHQAATASREQNSQQRAGRTRRTSADSQRAQQGATGAAAAAPAALDSLSRLQQLADASPRVAQLRRLQALADIHYAPVAQLAGAPEEEERVQGQFASAELQPQLQQAPRANNTGLPDQLKSGIESLSGLSLDHVRVHYNSSQPAQLNALAYAQGSDIHLAPGQERHLPHEAWHVVQQAQGRVQPTLQMKDGVPVNDDVGLEREADVMGTKALEGGHRAVEAYRSISMPIETEQPIDGDAMNSPVVKVANNHSAPLADGRGSAQRARAEPTQRRPAAEAAHHTETRPVSAMTNVVAGQRLVPIADTGQSPRMLAQRHAIAMTFGEVPQRRESQVVSHTAQLKELTDSEIAAIDQQAWLIAVSATQEHRPENQKPTKIDGGQDDDQDAVTRIRGRNNEILEVKYYPENDSLPRTSRALRLGKMTALFNHELVYHGNKEVLANYNTDDEDPDDEHYAMFDPARRAELLKSTIAALEQIMDAKARLAYINWWEADVKTHADWDDTHNLRQRKSGQKWAAKTARALRQRFVPKGRLQGRNDADTSHRGPVR